MPPIESIIWKILAKDSSVHFGQECAAAASWAVISMIMRLLVQLLMLEEYVPPGFIFGFPFIAQIFSKYIPTLKNKSPFLSVRLAESLVAKDHIGKIFLLFPAHFLGSIIGIVWFRTIFPFISRKTLSPLYCTAENVPIAFITEVFSNFVLVTILLVLPYVFEVNRLSALYSNLPLLLVLALSSSNFNPSMIFGLWALNSNILIANSCALNVLRIAGSCVGALSAGWFCSNFFPDDPSSWTRSFKKHSK